MLKLDRPVIVEGKFDKLRLASVIDTTIITTNGFRIFNDREKRALIRRLAEKNGIIVLTDADGAGMVIRNLLRGCVPKEKVTHLYIPAIKGKERRKAAPSKEGYLGVEGIDLTTLEALFAPFAVGAEAQVQQRSVTKADFYAAGLSGGTGSAEKRDQLAALLDLPPHMSANALLEAINLLCAKDAYEAVLRQLNGTCEGNAV